MNAQIRNRIFGYDSIVANLLVVVAGGILIAVSFVVGLFALAVIFSMVLVLAAINVVRQWWLRRRAGFSDAATKQHSGRDAATIEGEFKEITRQRPKSGP